MKNFFFATDSGSIYHVGDGTIIRVDKADQRNVPTDMRYEPFTWNVEPVIGFRADYILINGDNTSGRFTSEVTHIWPAPVGYSMLPDTDYDVYDNWFHSMPDESDQDDSNEAGDNIDTLGVCDTAEDLAATLVAMFDQPAYCPAYPA